MRIFLILALLPLLAPARPHLLVIGDNRGASSDTLTYPALLAASLDTDLTFIQAETVVDVPADLPAADVIVLGVGLSDALQATPAAEEAWPAAYGALLERLHAPTIIAMTPFRVLPDTDASAAPVARYGGYISFMAQARGHVVSDLWMLRDCLPQCVSADGVHPNDIGHQAIADTTLAALLAARLLPPPYVLEWTSKTPVVYITASSSMGADPGNHITMDGRRGWLNVEAPRACVTIRGEAERVDGSTFHVARTWDADCDRLWLPMVGARAGLAPAPAT